MNSPLLNYRNRILNPANPINWEHSLNRGLVGCWMVPPNPGFRGAQTFWDLTRGSIKPNNGTLTNGPTWQPGSRPGGYGVVACPKQGYVTAAGNELVRVSYAMWARWQLSGATDYPYALGTYENGSPGTTDRRIKFNATDITWSIYDGATKTAVYTTGANNDIWWHIVGTADGSNIRLYVNGVLRATTAAGDPFTGYTNPQIWFGSVGTSATAAVSVDDVRSYSRALTDSEAYALYNQSRRGHPDTMQWVSTRAAFSAGAAPPATPGVFNAAWWMVPNKNIGICRAV